MPSSGIRPKAMAAMYANPNDLWNHRLSQVAALLQAPELHPSRKWIKLVDLVEDLEWSDFCHNNQEAKRRKITEEASPTVDATVGFVGGGAAALQTHQIAHSPNVPGGIAQMPAAAAPPACSAVPSKEAIIEANRRAALAARAVKQAQAVAMVRASNSHADLMSQLG